MPSQFVNWRNFDAPPQAIVEAIDGALRDVGAHAVNWSSDQRTAEAKIGWNIRSWGEKLAISISESGDVRINSVCSFPLQIVDWGKNAKNCRRFLQAVADRIGSRKPSV